MLSTIDHRRDSAGLLYVYPVVSRRAGGVSVGINLNPNNACNWACVYCQVEDLQRGGPPPIDLLRLEAELRGFLDRAVHGDFLTTEVPVEARRLVDVAFSGNGEPTSAAEFVDAVGIVGRVLAEFGLAGQLPVRLITNGSLLHRPEVRRGIRLLAEFAGEVWFKVDRATPDEVLAVNGIHGQIEKMAKNLGLCAGLAPTWVQTCWFCMDGVPPSAAAEQAYFSMLKPWSGVLAGVHLYGLARPSQQPGAARLSALPAADLVAFGDRLQKETGIGVRVSP